MQVPESEQLTTGCLGRIFDKTVATYKYFWFLSLMQEHARTGNLRIDVWKLVIRMVANAWYPIHYFRLSFGKSDSLFEIVTELQKETNLPIDASQKIIIEELRGRLGEQTIRSRLRVLTLNVPYRFLRPWIDTSDDREMIRRSQTLENSCLYALYKDRSSFYIELNPSWDSYLHAHYGILVDFTYWNLTQFLQVRNPNVPAISNKLIKPETRTPLTAQHRYWNTVMQIVGPIECIYTGRQLHTGEYELDHFIPWSFVSHDLLWNLVPADGSVNSSKSDRLPDLERYLPKMAHLQYHALQTYLKAGRDSRILEDYLSLGHTPRELVLMDEDNFLELYKRTFGPMNQIALNMGFETWKG